MDLGKVDLSKLTPEQAEVLRHILVIDQIDDQEAGVLFLRQIYYETWGEFHNGRNQ